MSLLCNIYIYTYNIYIILWMRVSFKPSLKFYKKTYKCCYNKWGCLDTWWHIHGFILTRSIDYVQDESNENIFYLLDSDFKMWIFWEIIFSYNLRASIYRIHDASNANIIRDKIINLSNASIFTVAKNKPKKY